MEKLLLAVDGSESSKRATEYVCKLFANGAPLEIHLLNVQETLLVRVAVKFSEEEREKIYKDNSDSDFVQTISLLNEKKIPYLLHYAQGAIAPTISQVADQLACDRIVMGTRGRNALVGALLGSITHKVIYYSNVPVTLVK